MKKTFIFLTSLLCGIMAQAQEVSIARFLGNKPAAVSLTYDDGLTEHYNLVAPELEKRGFRGTFWIIGNVVGTKTEHGDRLTWDQIRDMAKRGHEMASHTWSHPNAKKVGYAAFMYDVWRNDSAFFREMHTKPMTLAYPYNVKTPQIIAYLDSDRIGSRTFQVAHGQQNNKQTIAKMSAWMHELIGKKDWGVTMTHGIKIGYDKWYHPEELWQFYDTLKAYQDSVWVCTFADGMAYKREKENTKFDCTSWNTVNGLRTMTVTPHCALDTTLFKQPLTICINTNPASDPISNGVSNHVSDGASVGVPVGVPDDFNVKAEQDGKELRGYADPEDHARTLFDINPFGGPVTITETKVLDIIGDSYVQNHRRPFSEAWHCKMAKELGYVYNNYGKNGACVAFDRTHDGKFNFGPAMTTKTKMLDPRADYVIIIAGHNDACKIGNNKDSLNMFREALETLIGGIQKQCPKAKIGYVTPWYNDVPGFSQVVKAIKKICKAHGIPVLDNYRKDCVIKVRDADFRKKYFQGPNDNAHLNANGHDLMLPIGKAWFEQNVK